MTDPVSFNHIVEQYTRKINTNLRGLTVDCSGVSIGRVDCQPFSQPDNDGLLPNRIGPEVAVTEAGKAEFRTSQCMERSAEIQIHKGHCEDLKKKVSMILPLGTEVEAQVDLEMSEPQMVFQKDIEIVISSSCGKEFRAKSVTNVQEQAVSFMAEVRPKGEVAFINDDPQLGFDFVKTQKIIRRLKEKNDPSVNSFHKDQEGFYYWIVEGICKMKIPKMHAHHTRWNQN